MNLFNILTFILTILALIGVILNIKKNSFCFVIWVFTNVSWSIVDFYKGIPLQGILFAVYTLLSVYGIFQWRKNERD
jgi:nicotinamide riboside transporter PnuC